MFSGKPKYQTSSTIEGYDDDDDDEVEGVEMPPPKGSKPKLPAASEAAKASSSGRLIPTTLDYYWQKKPPQHETATPMPISTALGEKLQKQQQSVARKTPTVDSPSSDHAIRRVRRREVLSSSNDSDSEEEEEEEGPVVVVLNPKASKSKTKPGPRPSIQLSRRDEGRSPIKSGSGSTPVVSKPFSKRDLLRQFEERDSDSGLDEVMIEDDETSDTEDGTSHGHFDEMDEDPFHDAFDQEDDDDEEEEEESEDEGDELIGIGSRRIPGFSQNPLPQQMEISGTDEDSEEEEDGDDDDDEDGTRTPTKTGLSNVDVTPRRSMANPNLLQDDPEELERQEEIAKQEIVKEVLSRHAEVAAKTNFDIIVTTPNFEDVVDHLFNPDEWEAFAIDSRWTGEDGHVTYTVIYKDGHTRAVEANDILDHVEPQILEEFENGLFAREENPETWYYPNFKAPGGAFAGGTGITSGVTKRRGRRSEAKIFLDNCYRLGMPEEFNIPMTDSSEDDDSDDDEEIQVEDVAGVRGPILASQYDKFDITDAEILATIQENESDNESWDGGRKSGRGRPRGRPSTSTRDHTMTRPTRAAARRGRGRPPLTPTRGGSTSIQQSWDPLPLQVQSGPAPKTNVVKASATSRGRGRPRGSKNIPRMDSPASSREDTPLSFTVSAKPLVSLEPAAKPPSTRGRPKGSKNLLRPAAPNSNTSNASETSSLSDFALPIRPITPIRPLDLTKISTPKTITKPKTSTPQKRVLKPTRTPKPPGTPSGARGPGRPPKAQQPQQPQQPTKEEDDLILETIRTAGANIQTTTSSHRRTLSATGQLPLADLERPKKRRRIRFGLDGPEEVSDDGLPRRKITVPANLPPAQPTSKNFHEKQQKQRKPAKKSGSDNDKKVFSQEVDRIINKMLLDGAPAYHVQLHGPELNKQTMWVRLENLQSKDARRKVKEFEADLLQRERDAKLARDRISAQLQRDKQRLAEREAQILGTKVSGKQRGEEEEREEKEKEEQRQRERIARRLAIQETLFAGT
ncbi:hypothetical protein TWF281_000194 [Arthrobotrys megalospora]